MEKEFVKWNRKFKQVLETSNFFMYEVIAYGDKYYEVFKKLETKYICQNGKWIKTGKKEYKYPSDCHFGIWAWCCSNEKRVMKVLKKLQVSESEISVFKDFFLQGNTRVLSNGESV